MEHPDPPRALRAHRPALSKLLGFAMLGLTCATAWAAAGALRWEDRFDAGYNFPLPPPILPNSTAVAGKSYFVAGSYPFFGSPGSNANIHLRAYDAGSGGLQWESVWAPTGSDDEATGLTTAGSVVVVVGSTGLNSTGNNAFVVRAFDAANGGTLWQDQCGSLGPSGAAAVTSANQRVFAAGSCAPASDGDTGLLRAYAAASGALLWEVRGADAPRALAVSGKLLFELANASGDLALRAYDTRTGTLLWDTPIGTPGTQFASQLLFGGGVVYVAWETGTTGGTVRGIAAFAARTGAGLWRADPGARVTAMAWSPGRLFAAKSGGDTLLTAYGARNGAVSWQDQPGTMPATYSPAALTVAGSQLFLAGSRFEAGTEDAANWLVRAYTLQGQLNWEDDEPATNELDAQAADLAWANGTLFAAGMSGRDTPPFGMVQWWVRAYDTKGSKGKLRLRWRP